MLFASKEKGQGIIEYVIALLFIAWIFLAIIKLGKCWNSDIDLINIILFWNKSC